MQYRKVFSIDLIYINLIRNDNRDEMYSDFYK